LTIHVAFYTPVSSLQYILTSEFQSSSDPATVPHGFPDIRKSHEFPAQSPQDVISTVKAGRRFAKSLRYSELTENDGHVDEELAVCCRRQESRRGYAKLGWVL